MIWEYSLPEPRVYEVLDAPNAKQKTPAQQGLMFANVHPEPPPALSAVCRESRYFVLHHYKPLTLGATTKFVDLSRDMLLLEPYLLVKRLHRTLHFMSQIPLVRDNINRLALGTSYGVYTGICHPVLSWKVAKNNMGKLLSSLAKFPKLKMLVFIVHQEFQFEFDFRFPGTMTPMPTAMPSGHMSTMSTTPLPGLPPTPPTIYSPPSPPSALAPPGHNQQHQNQPPRLQSSQGQTQEQQILPRPQLVHQAYRFKFDIEANINHTPRRPHLNELLYYPLDIDEDKDDWDLGDLLADDGGGEWCDPWPTNDDWRRFRKRWARAMVLSAEMGLVTGEGEVKEKGRKRKREGEREREGACVRGASATGSWGGVSATGEKSASWWAGLRGGEADADGDRGGEVREEKRRMVLPVLKGASLLWRYTRGGYV